MTLKTGATTSATPGGQPGYDGVQFSRPDGLALLVGGPPVRRLGLDGSAQVTFPTAPATAGTGAKETGGENGGYAETPTGGTLAIQAAHGLDIVSNSGTFERYIPTGTGGTTCILVKWWQTSDLLLTCGAQMVLQPVTGGTATSLTAASTQNTYLDAWTLTTGTIAEAGACGTTWLNSVSSSGTVTKLTVPGATGSVRGLGATGDRILALGVPACDQSQSATQTDVLEWYMPSTGKATPLLGTVSGSSAGGWVDTAELFGDQTG
jgi:hypothetical protein